MRATILMFALIQVPLSNDPASAYDQNLTLNLGTVLGSEEFCGLAYDQKAIEAFIDKNVAADDMGFAAELNSMASGTKYQNKEMTPSEKTAHCTQIQRVAKSFAFIR
jgi:hypothetical protein